VNYGTVVGWISAGGFGRLEVDGDPGVGRSWTARPETWAGFSGNEGKTKWAFQGFGSICKHATEKWFSNLFQGFRFKISKISNTFKPNLN
jgi:hypothetical protein